MTLKVVICGAGFIGSHVARAFAALNPEAHVVLASRKPSKIPLRVPESASKRLTYASVDIAIPSTLRPVFQDANVVVSLVGILHGNKAIFEAIQWKGAENVAMAAQEVGAKLVHLSAIGADANSPLISPRTKGLGELSVLSASPAATIIRPSLVFGPGDSFFTRFATLSRFLPVMPVFGGGKSKFQPVYVGDLARLITLCSHSPKPEVANEVEGAIIEAGGPDIFTYRQIMELVLQYTGRRRPIISLPFFMGKLQGAILEQFPENIFTLSPDQVSQLALDNIVSDQQKYLFPKLLEMEGGGPRMSVYDILPTYL